MRYVLIVLVGLAAILAPTTVEACEIEDWRFLEHTPNYIKIDGTTTCSSASMSCGGFCPVTVSPFC